MYVENLSESAIAKQCDENSTAIKALSKAIEGILPLIPTQLATVATTGDYDDLLNKPVIPIVPELASVATSGDYDDLLNKPAIPVVPELAAVATSGDYDDLVDKPSLATVATTGDYDDLLNKPTIPVVPTLAAVATSGDYDDLINKPSIPSISGLAEDDLSNVVLPTADAGKYLKIAADGSIAYDTPGGGASSPLSLSKIDPTNPGLSVGDLVLIISGTGPTLQVTAVDFSTAPTQVKLVGNSNKPISFIARVTQVQSNMIFFTVADNVLSVSMIMDDGNGTPYALCSAKWSNLYLYEGSRLIASYSKPYAWNNGGMKIGSFPQIDLDTDKMFKISIS
jgi:hypothetical protein